MYSAQGRILQAPSNSRQLQNILPTKLPAWQFGHHQKIQARKIRASAGEFTNLSGNITDGTLSFTAGTITNILLNEGTVANVILTGATINTSIFEGGTVNGLTAEGGTMNNGVYGSPKINGGTFNNGVIGSPSLTGGTVNPSALLFQGTIGVNGSVIYMKTVAPTYGTIVFSGGLITSFS